MKVCDQLHAAVALPPPPPEGAPGTHWIGGWVSSRAGLDVVVMRKIPSLYQDSNSAVPLSCPGSYIRARCIQSTPSHTVSLRSIGIFNSHLRLDLPSVFFPSGFQTRILYAFLMSPMLATYSAHLV
jgi:hypothetical protein